MFVESLDVLPESLRGQFVEVEIDGKKGYQDKDSYELRQHLFNVKDENKQVKQARQELEGKLSALEQAKQQEIEAARQKALDEARSKGDVKAIEERYEQQMADLRERVAKEARDATLKEVAAERATEKAANIRKQIAAQLAVDEDSADALDMLIASRVKVDPDTGKEIYYNAEGGALSVDKAGFIAELKQDKRLMRLIKSDVTTSGGGMANGGGNGGALPKSLKDMTPTEEAIFANKYPERYKELLNQLR